MGSDQQPARPVTVSIPGQRSADHDGLDAGPDRAAPAPAGWGPRALGGAAALALAGIVVVGQGVGTPPPAAPVGAEPVSLSLLTTVASAAPVRRQDGAALSTMRVRVALRNGGPSWITLEDVALGPYRATGDGLGAVPPGGLASVPLERLVACGSPASTPAPRFLEVDVLGGGGRTQVYLGLLEPAAVDPAAILPACTTPSPVDLQLAADGPS